VFIYLYPSVKCMLLPSLQYYASSRESLKWCVSITWASFVCFSLAALSTEMTVSFKSTIISITYVDVAFIVVIVDIYKMETLLFSITFQLILLLAMKERKFCFFSSEDLSDLLPVLLSEPDNCASHIYTSTISQRDAPVKRS
jgi:hypothetical protein